MRYLLHNRESGMYDIEWIGKAYFVSCIFVTIAASRYFDLFQPDTASWLLLQYAVKGLALLFLSQSTSSSTVSFVLVLIGLFYDNLCYYTWLYWICLRGAFKKPTYKYIGKKVQ